jgi:hypothetical protein
MRYVEKDIGSSKFTITTNSITKLPITKYKDKLVILQNFLLQLYSYRCGYCGIVVGQEWVGEIEHFYYQAEDSYFDHIWDLRNLHIACKRCNSKKAVIDAERQKIWSPNHIAQNPKDIINKNYCWFHIVQTCYKKAFKYERSFLKVIGEPLTGYSAKKTVEVLDLNGEKTRKYLIELRIRLFSRAKKMLDQIVSFLIAAKSCRDCKKQSEYLLPIKSLIENFELLFSNESIFAEMIRDNFTKDLILMKACYEQLKLPCVKS